MAQQTLAPDLRAADRQVGIVVGVIGVVVALFMIACVAGLSMYYSAFYGVAH